MVDRAAEPQPLARQARDAADAGDWPAARAAWTACLAASASPPVAWSLGLLRAIAATGDVAAARTQAALLLSRHPGNEAARTMLLRLLLDRHDRAALAEEAATGSLAATDYPEGLLPHFRALAVLGDLPAARAVFDRLLPLLTLPSRLQILFDRAPSCFGPVRLRARWKALAARLEASDGRDDGEREAEARRTLALRLDIARGHHAAFLARWAEAGNVLPDWHGRFAGLARRLAKPGFPHRGERKVFGIGLSKSGTTPLAAALEILGYDTAHFRNPFTNAIIEEADADLFDALNDDPVAARFEVLHARYPNALFIQTERDVASWEDSVLQHRMRARGTTEPRDIEVVAAADGPDSPFEPRLAIHRALWNQPSLAQVHAVFDQRVASFFDAHPGVPLLRLNIFEGQGWPELCAFLGHAVPDQPFPHRNRGRTDGAAQDQPDD